MIWTPKLNIFHFSAHAKSLDFSKEMATVTHTGEITLTFTAIVSSYCQIFGKYYPMDEHKCHLPFQYKARSYIIKDLRTREFFEVIILKIFF